MDLNVKRPLTADERVRGLESRAGVLVVGLELDRERRTGRDEGGGPERVAVVHVQPRPITVEDLQEMGFLNRFGWKKQ